MPAIHIDFETYSELDLTRVQAWRYARHPSTEVLICCYKFDDSKKVHTWLPFEEDVPDNLLEAAQDPEMEFHAFNAGFERPVWKHTLRRQHPELPDIPIERWFCTAYIAAANGLGRTLNSCLGVLGTGVEKDPEGKRLIKIFSMPRKPTKKDPRKRILPREQDVDFQKFIRYCRQDVVGECELADNCHPLTERQWELYHLDCLMNERGLPFDMPMVRQAQVVLKVLQDRVNAEILKLTGGIKATQVAKLKAYLEGMGLELENMKAQTVKDLLKNRKDIPEKVKRLLLLRMEAGKASIKKLVAMVDICDPTEGIAQGMFLIHGAHTGRYAGRGVQPQNFVRGMLKEYQQTLVFALLAEGDPWMFLQLYEWPIDIISQCMRGFIKAPKGYEFYVVDYAAIEARLLAWVANEVKMLRLYREGVDVYKRMASIIYNIPVEKVSSEQRRIAKNVVLGCGYNMSAKKFVIYCALQGVIVSEELGAKAVKLYRKEHPNIVASWKEVQAVCARVIRTGKPERAFKCKFHKREHWLCVKLPSGREIRYPHAKATPVERYGKPDFQISFRTDYHGKPVRESTYGGKIIENIVQGIAFDVMGEGMLNAEAAKYRVHGTVHDEALTLRKKGTGDIKALEKIVCQMPRWADGIPLSAEGFVCERYRK